jgi:peroxiredoxin
MAPGVFYTNKRYRITFGVWSDCEGWRQSSWLLQFVPGMAKPQVTPLQLREQDLKFAPVTNWQFSGSSGTSEAPRIAPPADIVPGAKEAGTLPLAEDDATTSIAEAQPTVKVGQAARQFTAIDAQGNKWSLAELRNKKNVLLTFFPKCFTGGCANHLSSLRDRQAQFDGLDTQILAVSVDPAEGERGQLAFAKQWQFAFPLSPDTDRRLSMLYGAAQNERQLAGRMTIFIDKQGVVRLVDTNVNVVSHGADMLERIRAMKLDSRESADTKDEGHQPRIKLPVLKTSPRRDDGDAAGKVKVDRDKGADAKSRGKVGAALPHPAKRN